MNEEVEQTPEAGDPVGEARSVYQEYVDSWKVDPTPDSQKLQQTFTILTKRGPESQTGKALSLAKENAEFGFSRPAVFFLELTELNEKDKWQILAESLAKEAEKTTRDDEAKAKELRKKAETLHRGIQASK